MSLIGEILSLTFCDPIDCSPPGSSVHGIIQAGILEWEAIPFSRGSSWPRDQTRVSLTAGRFLYHVSYQWIHLHRWGTFWIRITGMGTEGINDWSSLITQNNLAGRLRCGLSEVPEERSRKSSNSSHSVSVKFPLISKLELKEVKTNSTTYCSIRKMTGSLSLQISVASLFS